MESDERKIVEAIVCDLPSDLELLTCDELHALHNSGIVPETHQAENLLDSALKQTCANIKGK